MIKNYIPIDEWFYYKIYLSPLAAERILFEDDSFYEITNYLLNNNVIDKWFFIRYGDPQFHIRLRFHVINKELVHMLINKINDFFKRYIDVRLVEEIKIESYIPELDRYGINTIFNAENIFYIDSNFVTKLLMFEQVFRVNMHFRRFAGLKVIDSLLDSFSFDLQSKYNIIYNLMRNYENIVGSTKETRKYLDKYYRENKINIYLFLESCTKVNDGFNSLIEERYYLLTEEYEKMNVISSDVNFKNKLMNSFIHMSVNRFFIEQANIVEYSLYTFLYKYYKSKLYEIQTKME